MSRVIDVVGRDRRQKRRGTQGEDEDLKLSTRRRNNWRLEIKDSISNNFFFSLYTFDSLVKRKASFIVLNVKLNHAGCPVKCRYCPSCYLSLAFSTPFCCCCCCCSCCIFIRLRARKRVPFKLFHVTLITVERDTVFNFV